MWRDDNNKMIGRLYRSSLAIWLAKLTALTPVAPTFAQQQEGQPAPAPPPAQPPVRTIQVSNQNYTNGKRWFPNIIAPFTPTLVPEPVRINAPRIERMIHNGKHRFTPHEAI